MALNDKKVSKPKKVARKSRDLNKDSDYKLELANSIAKNSKKVVNTYAHIENSVIYFFRWISSIIDKFMFNAKFSKYTSLLLAIVLYIAVSTEGKSTGLLANSSGLELDNIPVQVIVNTDAYEVSGLPETVTAMIIGDASDVQLVKSQTSYKVTADLSGLTEGTHQIKLSPVDFSNRLSISLNPSNVVVTIRKKTTEKFKLTSEYVNVNKMDKIYALETAPVLSTTEVLVKASQDTIDQIAYVKALIDVTGVKQNFETTAPIVAYNQQGQMLDVDIFPETVTASVSVTTPMKEVPIKVKPIGELPNGMAIESINLDHSTVQVYAPNSVLSTLDEIVVELDATKITKNSNWTYSLTLPSGVNSFSITKVNIDVKIAESLSRTVDGVVVRYKNNAAGYKLNLVDSRDAMLSVTVTGTEKNIKNITADDINLYIDLANITSGTNQDLPIVIEGKVGLVNYAIADGRTSLAVSVVE